MVLDAVWFVYHNIFSQKILRANKKSYCAKVNSGHCVIDFNILAIRYRVCC